MIEKSVKLYLGDGFPVRIPVSQYDTMWRFVFSIINGSVEWEIPSGATAVLNGRKPDGNVIAISGTIANNKVTVDATEQMTVVAGEVVCELSIMSGGAVVGTANFTLAVEDAPKKNGEAISESDLSAYAEMIEAAGELVEAAQEIIEQGPFLPPGGAPGQVLTKTANGEEWGDVSGLPDGGSNGQVLTKHGDGAEWSDAGTPTQAQTNTALADYLDEHPEAVTNIPDRIKQALLACFQKVAWVDAHGQDYYDALYDALMNKELISITAVFTQGSAIVCDSDSLDTLRQYLTVTALYDDGTTGVVTDYTLSGTLTAGTSTIAVAYGGKSTSFSVSVKHNYATSLANWRLSGTPGVSYADGELSLQCLNSTAYNNYSIWAADIDSGVMWDDVNGKTFKIRVKAKGANFGELSNDNRIIVGAFAWKDNTITSIAAQNRKGKTVVSIAPTGDYVWYEETFVCDLSAFTTGTLTPTSQSTFGGCLTSRSYQTAIISEVQIVEVEAE